MRKSLLVLGIILGEGTGRPQNTLSSPEKAAGEVAEQVFEKVFKR